MNLGEVGCEDVTCIELAQNYDFGVSGIEPSGSVTK
jgi:hypothetical protein